MIGTQGVNPEGQIFATGRNDKMTGLGRFVWRLEKVGGLGAKEGKVIQRKLECNGLSC